MITQTIISALASVLTEDRVLQILERMARYVRESDPIESTELDNQILKILEDVLKEARNE